MRRVLLATVVVFALLAAEAAAQDAAHQIDRRAGLLQRAVAGHATRASIITRERALAASVAGARRVPAVLAGADARRELARLGLAARSAGALARAMRAGRGSDVRRLRALVLARLRAPRRALLAALAARAPAPVPSPPAAPPAATPAPAPAPTLPPPPIRYSGYVPHELAPALRPYGRTAPASLEPPPGGLDPETGCVRFYQDGVETAHPTVVETYGVLMVESARLDPGEPEYLRRARGCAKRLLDHAVTTPGGGLYMAYDFAFDPFDDPAQRLAAPWVSGMAQGRALLFFERLAEVDPGNPEWKHVVGEIWRTIDDPPNGDHRWWIDEDPDGYLWAEEYPTDAPAHVLNGHMSALFGVWEYAVDSGDPRAAKLFDALATTALHGAIDLRIPGQRAAYSYRTRGQPTTETYHAIHVAELRTMATLTGDPAFSREADLFAADAPGKAG